MVSGYLFSDAGLFFDLAEGEESEPGPDGPVKKRRKKRKKKDENEDEPEEDPFANLSPEEREKKEKELAKMSQKGRCLFYRQLCKVSFM